MENQANAGAAKAKTAELPYTVPSGKPFQDRFGPCRSTQLDLIAKGELESVLSGAGPRGRRLIYTASWLAYLERQRQREADGEIGMASPNPRARTREAAPTPKRPASLTRRKALKQRKRGAP